MKINDLNIEIASKNLPDRFFSVVKSPFKIAFSTSFSLEDQIITYLIYKHKLPIEIFTIDTGRLHDETYQTWSETIKKYDIKILTYYPNHKNLEKFVNKNGINSFYLSKELRIKCCEIRKIQPLKIALKGFDIWISGLRKQHSTFRQDKDFIEYDDNLKIFKFYPLLDFDEKQIWQFIDDHQIPFNPLYKNGFKSIGCSPCTKAVSEEDDIRSGRWWWEKDSNKECGIHFKNNKIIRINYVGNK